MVVVCGGVEWVCEGGWNLLAGCLRPNGLAEKDTETINFLVKFMHLHLG